MQNPKYPNFLGIGAQKSATSWLDKMLRYHPDLYLPDKKEIHFFDLHYLNGLEWYSNHFMFAGNRVRGEITPAYALLKPEVIEFIRSLIPDLKSIFLMRDPIDRAWSHALMEFLTVQSMKYEDVTEAQFIEHFRGEGSVSRGDYAANLRNWYRSFDRDSVYLGYFTEVASDPQKLLDGIFRHIGIDPDRFDWDHVDLDRKVFQGKDIKMPQNYREILTEIYTPKINELYELIGDERVLEWVG